MDQRQSNHVAVAEEQEETTVGPMLIDKLEVGLIKNDYIAIWF